MARPPADLDDYLDWQERLESFKASGLSIDEFCLQEGVSRSTYYRWVDALKNGLPESMVAEKETRERAESGKAAFVPLSVGQVVLVEVIRAVGALRPWKAPKS